ncbi:MAG TPA: TetR/AcrR family transcriptional regulator [Xanthobacteraceae bacterium]|nr:TetR/AcrR family transcriptional regulator [Xanthobacteraceae bacterium]
MARKPARAKADPPATPAGTDRERIIAAFMALLAEKSFERIDLAEIAARADVKLGTLRGEFPSTLAILAAHMKAMDRAVLDGGDGDMSEEPPRERLFDVLMRRIEAMTPYKEALRSLMRSARRNPGLAFALNAMAVRSQQWMLAAADIHSSGPRGMLRAQGLALIFARVVRTFVHDDDEGHARTMAELDRALGRGARLMGMVDDLCRFVPGCRPRRRHRRDWDEEEGDDEATVAA